MKRIRNNKERPVKISPRKNGWKGINIICSHCGAYFSEFNGHTCSDYGERMQ